LLGPGAVPGGKWEEEGVREKRRKFPRSLLTKGLKSGSKKANKNIAGHPDGVPERKGSAKKGCGKPPAERKAKRAAAAGGISFLKVRQ